MSFDNNTSRLRLFLFVAFTISGFSGLIYESIWAHYLKLLLGHAAYAQTIVLSIFMGGMALGAFITSKFSIRIKQPLLVYAVIEGIIGLFALIFHPVFTGTLDVLFNQLIPSMSSPAGINIIKWGFASLLILPQSILLGMTFPVMSAGIIRISPSLSGSTLGSLYFTNSIGAALGVLTSAFVLIPAVGLPGTVLTAGILNVGLAIIVWMISKSVPVLEPLVQQQAKELQPSKQQDNAMLIKLFLLAAFLTGLASFIYEISWIRMLSQVLGSTFQAFEIMLSAFITGLAFGGLWIARRISKITNPVRYSAYVQIIMGLLALGTVPAYNYLFDFMGFMISSLTKTDGGYLWFNFTSHALALVIMLPATFMAGMTLPLFTYSLIQKGSGEESIGRIYAANTIGAICGIVLSVHLLMPLAGTQLLFEFGVLIDIGLGLGLLYYTRRSLTTWEYPAAAVCSILLLIVVAFGSEFSPMKQASGVYRHGKSELPAGNQILFNKDGKTSTVVVNKESNDIVVIRTNGKPDASANLDLGMSTADEITMKMAAALPLSFHPEAKSVANIGMGSGMTTSALLSANTIELVDTIEIEQAMVEGARFFGQKVALAFSDPRSHIYIDDAKTFFSSHSRQYDIIVSEPSNPWVTGVASLFTTEFYEQIKNYMNPDGLLVQWLQLYETNFTVMSSVFRALAASFDDFVVFNSDDGNMLIIASMGRDVNTLNDWIFKDIKLASEMKEVGIISLEDLIIRRIGNKRTLLPFFASTGAPANSDYFPFVSLNAPRSRYLGENAVELSWTRSSGVPVLEMLDAQNQLTGRNITPSPYFSPSRQFQLAKLIQQAISNRVDLSYSNQLPEKLQFSLKFLLDNYFTCSLNEKDLGFALESILEISKNLNPYSGKIPATKLWENFSSVPCYQKFSQQLRSWIELHTAVGARDKDKMYELAKNILDDESRNLNASEAEYLLMAGLSGLANQNGHELALEFWNKYSKNYMAGRSLPLSLRLLLSHLR